MEAKFTRPEVPEGMITLVLTETEAVELYKAIPYYNSCHEVRVLLEELHEVLASNCIIEG
jgi:hypothetical protein